MKKIALIGGARPNYMKIFPLWRALKEAPDFQPLIIHTGQHYDHQMSKVFFDDLNLPDPDFYLGIGSGSHAEQIGRIMIALEQVLKEQKPAMAMVVGDVNSTVAGALAAAKMNVPLAHIEAGLRSFDRTMPEEINRVVTDAVSDLLFTSCRDADDNLKREGVSSKKVYFVGNIMIDSLDALLPRAGSSKILETLGLEPKNYIAVTLHRPANVDDPERLNSILEKLGALAGSYRAVFPAHPRTRKTIESSGLALKASRIKITEPLGYIDFLRLMSQAALVVTDSGGIQEETTFLGIPCLTLRPNTERPVTIREGTNRLIDPDKDDLPKAVSSAVERFKGSASRIEKWDGKTAGRILKVLKGYFN